SESCRTTENEPGTCYLESFCRSILQEILPQSSVPYLTLTQRSCQGGTVCCPVLRHRYNLDHKESELPRTPIGGSESCRTTENEPGTCYLESYCRSILHEILPHSSVPYSNLTQRSCQGGTVCCPVLPKPHSSESHNSGNSFSNYGSGNSPRHHDHPSPAFNSDHKESEPSRTPIGGSESCRTTENEPGTCYLESYCRSILHEILPHSNVPYSNLTQRSCQGGTVCCPVLPKPHSSESHNSGNSFSNYGSGNSPRHHDHPSPAFNSDHKESEPSRTPIGGSESCRTTENEPGTCYLESYCRSILHEILPHSNVPYSNLTQRSCQGGTVCCPVLPKPHSSESHNSGNSFSNYGSGNSPRHHDHPSPAFNSDHKESEPSRTPIGGSESCRTTENEPGTCYLESYCRSILHEILPHSSVPYSNLTQRSCQGGTVCCPVLPKPHSKESHNSGNSFSNYGSGNSPRHHDHPSPAFNSDHKESEPSRTPVGGSESCRTAEKKRGACLFGSFCRSILPHSSVPSTLTQEGCQEDTVCCPLIPDSSGSHSGDFFSNFGSSNSPRRRNHSEFNFDHKESEPSRTPIGVNLNPINTNKHRWSTSSNNDSSCSAWFGKPAECMDVRQCSTKLNNTEVPGLMKILASIGRCSRRTDLCCPVVPTGDDSNDDSHQEIRELDTVNILSLKQRPDENDNPRDHNISDIVTFKETPPNSIEDFVRTILPEQCGERRPTVRIFGGNATAMDEFPWMALLEYVNHKEEWATLCGGSVITNRHILTAAHCIEHRKTQLNGWELVSARLGEWNTESDPDCWEETGTSSMLKSRHCKPRYLSIRINATFVYNTYVPNSIPPYHDIGILRLERSVEFNDYIQPICLPSNDDVPTPLTVAGWGRTESLRRSAKLLKVTLPRAKKEICEKPHKLISTQLCFGGEKNKDSCFGDSGGPLMNLGGYSNRIHVIGIVSYGNSQLCGIEDLPGIYTKVYEYVPWIIEILGESMPGLTAIGSSTVLLDVR
ncbi:hypothetical protein QAD02_005670, partial [Eretmocerus hayati]